MPGLLVNLVNTRVLLHLLHPGRPLSFDLHGRYRRYPQNQPYLSFHLTRFSNPTVPQFHISNSASCLRHTLITPMNWFFNKFFFSHAKSFNIFSCHTKIPKASINVTQASFLCPAPSGLMFCTTTLATWLLGPGCRQLHQR